MKPLILLLLSALFVGAQTTSSALKDGSNVDPATWRAKLAVPSLTDLSTTGTITPKTGDLDLNDIGSVDNASVNAAIEANPTSTRNSARSASSYRPSLPHTMARMVNRRGSNQSYRLTQLVTGDSYAVNLSPQMDVMVARNAGNGGMVNTGFFGGSGAVDFDPGAGTVYWQSNDYTYSPTGCYIPLLSTELTNFGVSAGTVGFQAQRVDIFYSAVAGGGSFRVEQKIGSGAWTDLTTGQATAASPQSTDNGGTRSAGVLTINWAGTTTDLRLIRIIGVSGTSAIIGARWTNVTDTVASTGGTEVFDMSISGANVNSTSSCPQSIFTTIMGVIKPHFATWKADDSSEEIDSSLETFMGKVETGMGGTANIDWVLISSHPINAAQTNDLSAADITLRDIADSRGVLFVDIRGAMPPYAQYLAPLDFTLGVDDYHLGQFGIAYQNQIVMRSISDVVGPGRHTGAYNATPANDRSVEHAPFAWDRMSVLLIQPNANEELYTFYESRSTGLNYDTIHRATRYVADDTIGLSYSNNDYLRQMHGGGRTVFIGGTAGGGFSTARAYTRATTGIFESFTGNDTSTPAIISSTPTGHTGNSWEVRSGASNTVQGTATAACKPNGVASFTGLTLPPVAFANLPTSPATNTFATINNGPAFVAGNNADGTGSTKCLVQYDGTNWKMVLQLY